MLGILITARLGSRRLPDKHLKPVAGKPIMQYLLERINYAFEKDISAGKVKIIIATSSEQQNKDFQQFHPLAVPFFGDIKNIPLRHFQAALTHQLDAIIAVDGDDILCSPQAMTAVQQCLLNGDKYVTTEGLPFGLNTFGYSTEFLAKSLEKTDEEILETGWGRVFNHQKPNVVHFPEIKGHKDQLRFTLDYEEDLSFFRSIIEQLGDQLNTISDQSLVDFVIKEEIYRHNKNRIEEYWENFKKQQANHG